MDFTEENSGAITPLCGISQHMSMYLLAKYAT